MLSYKRFKTKGRLVCDVPNCTFGTQLRAKDRSDQMAMVTHYRQKHPAEVAAIEAAALQAAADAAALQAAAEAAALQAAAEAAALQAAAEAAAMVRMNFEK